VELDTSWNGRSEIRRHMIPLAIFTLVSVSSRRKGSRFRWSTSLIAEANSKYPGTEETDGRISGNTCAI